MTFNNLKKIFYTKLLKHYPKQEIDSFFYLLTEAFIGFKKVDIALEPGYRIDENQKQKFISALAKLKEEYPIQYIIGETEFYGLTFKVNKDVLIPRPETEELVNWVLQNLKSSSTADKLKILDIGTGSGCIAIALAKELSTYEVWALDISDKALSIAKENAKLNHVNINFIQKDILKKIHLNTKFDIIISNPPYVRELEKKQMQTNVLKYEPHLALFVENDNSLLFYDKIANVAKEYLAEKGRLYFEINQYLGKETIELLQVKGFKNIELKKDIFGVDRMVKAEIKNIYHNFKENI